MSRSFRPTFTRHSRPWQLAAHPSPPSRVAYRTGTDIDYQRLTSITASRFMSGATETCDALTPIECPPSCLGSDIPIHRASRVRSGDHIRMSIRHPARADEPQKYPPSGRFPHPLSRLQWLHGLRRHFVVSRGPAEGRLATGTQALRAVAMVTGRNPGGTMEATGVVWSNE